MCKLFLTIALTHFSPTSYSQNINLKYHQVYIEEAYKSKLFESTGSIYISNGFQGTSLLITDDSTLEKLTIVINYQLSEKEGKITYDAFTLANGREISVLLQIGREFVIIITDDYKMIWTLDKY